MANELRVRAGFLGGLIEDNPLTSGATTLNSAGLATMPVVGSTQHMAVVLDPDGFGGAPEVVYVTAHSAAATSATVLRAQEGTTARQHDRDTVWVHSVTVKDYDGSGGGSGLIGFTQYNPAANATITTTSTTFVDLDATNLVVAFTGPPSGRVLVRLSCLAQGPSSSGSNNWWWNLRDSVGDVANSEMYVSNYAGTAMRWNTAIEIVSLTPGTAYSWKWGAKLVSAGTGTLYVGRTAGTPQGPAIMEVWAVNV